MNILTPYIEYSDGDLYRRRSLDKLFGFAVWFDYDYRSWRCSFSKEPFRTAEEAKQDLDRSLSNSGYLFLTEKQYEKLKSLL
jgi:hypothetical protein